MIEWQTRNAIVRQITTKIADAVMKELNNIWSMFGDKFSYKTITSDNGSEFAGFSKPKADAYTQIYFTHPYSSFKNGTNERYNGFNTPAFPVARKIKLQS